MKIVCIYSGGLDSTTLVYDLLNQGHELELLSFSYKQRHKKELFYAQKNATSLGLSHHVIDISSVGDYIHTNALTSTNFEVPNGYYTEENMRITVVPNRNAIMLSIAWGIAVSRGADAIAIGVHSGDHHIYPDCRPEFIKSIEASFRLSTVGVSSPNMSILAPYINLTKSDIVKIGSKIRVPYQSTWTCYKGGAIHCGQCGACVERQEAFRLAGAIDKTVYRCPYDFNKVNKDKVQ